MPKKLRGQIESARFRTNDERWRALIQRNVRARHHFVYAVRTTGVFCLPGCASRRPLRKNVIFFESAESAMRAGFRFCLRCRSLNPKVADHNKSNLLTACERIRESQGRVVMSEVAASIGLSPSQFSRSFTAQFGVSPKAFAEFHRTNMIRTKLLRKTTVTRAILDSGYGSSSRFYATTKRSLAMTPTEYRRGGAGLNLGYAIGPCSLGLVLAAHSDLGICAIFLGVARDRLLKSLHDEFPKATIHPASLAFDDHLTLVARLVDHPSSSLNFPIDLLGTTFQVRVWKALMKIIPGRVTSYSALALKLGMPSAARAVAAACACNRLAVAVPCHRVIAKSGSLSGYRWGIPLKEQLISREQEP